MAADNCLKILSLNVAGLRAAWRKDLVAYVSNCDADILCIQETKMHAQCKPSIEEMALKGYHGYFLHAAKKGYSGTAVYTRIRPSRVCAVEGVEDPNGRCLMVEFARFFLVNCYIVNGGQRLELLDGKMQKFWPQLQAQLEELRRTKPVILCGDLNVAHEEIDIYKAEGHERTAGFTAEERAHFTAFLAGGWVDSFRALHPDEKSFTYFSYFGNARASNNGWRLDYFVLNREFWESGVVIDSLIDATPQVSDHIAVTLLLRREMVLDPERDVADADGVVTDIGEGKRQATITDFFARQT